MLNPEVFVNGKRGGQLSSLDRGLLYGDGVFETIAVKQGKLQHWEDHLERLQLGCEILNLQGLDIPLLQKEVHLLLESENNLKNIIKIIITRGVGGRGYKPTVANTNANSFKKFPWPKQPVHYIKKGVNVTQCKFRFIKTKINLQK